MFQEKAWLEGGMTVPTDQIRRLMDDLIVENKSIEKNNQILVEYISTASEEHICIKKHYQVPPAHPPGVHEIL